MYVKMYCIIEQSNKVSTYKNNILGNRLFLTTEEMIVLLKISVVFVEKSLLWKM